MAVTCARLHVHLLCVCQELTHDVIQMHAHACANEVVNCSCVLLSQKQNYGIQLLLVGLKGPCACTGLQTLQSQRKALSDVASSP